MQLKSETLNVRLGIELCFCALVFVARPFCSGDFANFSVDAVLGEPDWRPRQHAHSGQADTSDGGLVYEGLVLSSLVPKAVLRRADSRLPACWSSSGISYLEPHPRGPTSATIQTASPYDANR